MGPTGCGKTSLLNVLAARMPEGGSSNLKLTGTSPSTIDCVGKEEI
jgi:ABC-type molybdenum transport system ATPase subunit/photorepair protein PhrA